MSKGPIFSKAILRCRWLWEHENLSKVSKYKGKFLKGASGDLENTILLFEFCRSPKACL